MNVSTLLARARVAVTSKHLQKRDQKRPLGVGRGRQCRQGPRGAARLQRAHQEMPCGVLMKGLNQLKAATARASWAGVATPPLLCPLAVPGCSPKLCSMVQDPREEKSSPSQCCRTFLAELQGLQHLLEAAFSPQSREVGQPLGTPRWCCHPAGSTRLHGRLHYPYFQPQHSAYSVWWSQSTPREPLFEQSLLQIAIFPLKKIKKYQMLLAAPAALKSPISSQCKGLAGCVSRPQ